jgi:hypothetical protein
MWAELVSCPTRCRITIEAWGGSCLMQQEQAGKRPLVGGLRWQVFRPPLVPQLSTAGAHVARGAGTCFACSQVPMHPGWQLQGRSNATASQPPPKCCTSYHTLWLSWCDGGPPLVMLLAASLQFLFQCVEAVAPPRILLLLPTMHCWLMWYMVMAAFHRNVHNDA